MRTEKQMLELILEFARSRDDIRAVVMNGSRVNPNAKKDPFQDYDIACYVEDVTPYRGNMDIPTFFGDLIIMQTPEDMGDPEPDNDGTYGFLMQFTDGNRIDLSFHPLQSAANVLLDSLSLVLLDKDGCVPPLPPPSDRGYLPAKPTAKAYGECCNEFWWLNAYVAKGLWRGELTYARSMLDTLMRGELLKMLTWYFGILTDFIVSAGKYGKFLQAGLSPEEWQMLKNTYANADPQHTWEALFTMDELFRHAAAFVGDAFGFPYPAEDDKRVTAYVQYIRGLPADAQTLELPESAAD